MCFDQVLHFDYEKFKGSIFDGLPKSDFRVKDWGPAPRWVAFVDFFLASRARYAVISGAHRRVGTTYAQLIAALAAARNLGTCIISVPPIIFLLFVTFAPCLLKHTAEASKNCFLQETTLLLVQAFHFLAVSRVIC